MPLTEGASAGVGADPQEHRALGFLKACLIVSKAALETERSSLHLLLYLCVRFSGSVLEVPPAAGGERGQCLAWERCWSEARWWDRSWGFWGVWAQILLAAAKSAWPFLSVHVWLDMEVLCTVTATRSSSAAAPPLSSDPVALGVPLVPFLNGLCVLLRHNSAAVCHNFIVR